MEGKAMERGTDRRRKAERLESRTAACQLASLSVCEELKSESLFASLFTICSSYSISEVARSPPEKQKRNTLKDHS